MTFATTMTTTTTTVLFIILTVLAVQSTTSFSIISNASPRSTTTTTTARTATTAVPRTLTTQLNIFKGLGNAFANDESLSPRKNEGLSNGPNYNENVSVNGKKVPGAVVGQKLTVVANQVRVKIPVNCQAGDCGTCVVKLNGRKVKACQATLPSGKATITTL